MNKSELVESIARSSGNSKASVEETLDALADTVKIELSKGNEVTLHGIGKLKVSLRAARPGRNPATGEAMQIPEKKVPHFSAAKALKDAVAG